MRRVTGHVEKRGKRGYTTMVLDYGTYVDYSSDPPKSKRDRRKETIKVPKGTYLKKTEAMEILRKRLEQINGGNDVQIPDITLGEFLGDWLQQCRERQIPRPLSPKTLEGYEMHVELFTKELGKYPLEQVDSDLLEKTFNRLLAAGKGVRSMEQAYQVLNIAFNWAVEHDKMLANPLKKVPKPEPKRRKRTPLNVAELDKLLQVAEAEKSPIRHLMAFAAYTGLRRGELLALRWDHVDMENLRVYIDEAVSRVKGQAVTGPPKSDAGVRFVPLIDDALDILRELDTPDKHELVFCWPDGRPFRPDYVTKKIGQLIRKAGFSIRPHDLRHTFATLAHFAGVLPRTVQAILGHEDVETTYIYTHVLDEIIQQSAERMSEKIAEERRHQTGTKSDDDTKETPER